MFGSVFPAPTQIPFMWPFMGLGVASLQQGSKLFALLLPALCLPEVMVPCSLTANKPGNALAAHTSLQGRKEGARSWLLSAWGAEAAP